MRSAPPDRELRRGSPGIKIIAISAGAYQGNMDMLQIALRLGADEILYKPIAEERLLETVGLVSRKPAQELTVAGT